MFLKVIQVVAWISSLYWILLCIYLLMDGHLGCFHFPAIKKKATLNVPCSGSMWTCSLGHVPKRGTAGSSCNSFLITLNIHVQNPNSVLLPVFYHLPLRTKLLPSTSLCSTSVLCSKLSYSHVVVQLILWIAGKQGQAFCFLYSPTHRAHCPAYSRNSITCVWMGGEC